MRVRKFQSEVPPGKLQLGSCRVCRGEFDGAVLSLWPVVLGEVHRAMVRAAQILSQREFPGDDPAFPLVPCLGHIAPALPLVQVCAAASEYRGRDISKKGRRRVSSRNLTQYPINQAPARLGTLLSGFRRSRLGLRSYQRRTTKYQL